MVFYEASNSDGKIGGSLDLLIKKAVKSQEKYICKITHVVLSGLRGLCLLLTAYYLNILRVGSGEMYLGQAVYLTIKSYMTVSVHS